MSDPNRPRYRYVVEQEAHKGNSWRVFRVDTLGMYQFIARYRGTSQRPDNARTK